MPLTTNEQALVDRVNDLLEAFIHIPVYNEVGIPKESTVGKRDLITFAYDDWNTDFRFWVFLNRGQRELKSGTDYTLDATKGEIGLITTAGSSSFFKSDGDTEGELPVGQQIEASYHFRYFTDEMILCFMQLGLDHINNRRPVTSFPSVDVAPAEFHGAMIMYAYYRALAKVLLDNQIWNNHLIWASNHEFRNAMHSQVIQLKDESWREWELEAKFAKSRGFVKPRGVTGGRFATQQRVTGGNFQNFTIVGSTL